MKTIKTLLALLILLAIATAAYVWSGLYPIGADVPHWSVTYEILETLRDRSIAVHAENVHVPVLDTTEQVGEGAEHYDEMCRGCHLAPGMVGTEIRAGLYPQPPNLTQPSDLTPAEMFWTIKHGVKLSGMPAWGVTHSDAKIWAIVAFVRKLPGMTPEQYKALVGPNAGEAHEHAEEGREPAAGTNGGETHEHAGAEDAQERPDANAAGNRGDDAHDDDGHGGQGASGGR